MKIYRRTSLSVLGGILLALSQHNSYAANVVHTERNPANGHWYHLIRGPQNTGVNWTEAEAKANALGGNLVTINSAQEAEWLRTNFPGGGLQDYYIWIGLNDTAREGQFRWSSGEGVAYTNWASGEPNNFNGNEDFVHINNFQNGGFKWNDNGNIRQNDQFYFAGIAEVNTSQISVANPIVNPANGHTYHLLRGAGSEGLSWTMAQAKAVELGGNLVTINNAQEQSWIQSNFADPYIWVGLHDANREGNFEWVSGEPVSYSNWYSGEPNNFANDEDYVHIYNFSNGNFKWNDNQDRTDNSEGFRMSAVVEIPPKPPVTLPDKISIAPDAATLVKSCPACADLEYGYGTTELNTLAYGKLSDVYEWQDSGDFFHLSNTKEKGGMGQDPESNAASRILLNLNVDAVFRSAGVDPTKLTQEQIADYHVIAHFNWQFDDQYPAAGTTDQLRAFAYDREASVTNMVAARNDSAKQVMGDLPKNGEAFCGDSPHRFEIDAANLEDSSSIEIMIEQFDGDQMSAYNTRSGCNGEFEYNTGVLQLTQLTLERFTGDLNGDRVLDIRDIDLLSAAIRDGRYQSRYDYQRDEVINVADLHAWIDLKKTWIGDTNLDGEFNSGDIVQAFQGGQYEDNIARNSTWWTGDWNADGEFESGDIVDAFQAGGYEQGPRASTASVPEPSAVSIITGAACLSVGMCRRRRGALPRDLRTSARAT